MRLASTRRVFALGVAGLACGPASAHAAEGGLISVDGSLVIQIINFLILLAILYKVLYKPFLAKMEERTRAIRTSLEEAQQARMIAQREREENAAKIQAAYAEAQARREAALKEAAEEQARLVEAAKREAAQLVAGARSEMDLEVRRAKQELRREVSDLALAAAERLVRKTLREPDHRRIVDDALAELERAR
jgi:F-type H+-transporting ATPase subunit b